MAEYHVKLSALNGDEKEDIGYMIINAPPRGMGTWKSFGTAMSFNYTGTWVVGHAIGKSPQDSYYMDEDGTRILMLSAFIPRYDHSVGYEGNGRLINTTIPTGNPNIAFWLYEKDGKTPE